MTMEESYSQAAGAAGAAARRESEDNDVDMEVEPSGGGNNAASAADSSRILPRPKNMPVGGGGGGGASRLPEEAEFSPRLGGRPSIANDGRRSSAGHTSGGANNFNSNDENNDDNDHGPDDGVFVSSARGRGDGGFRCVAWTTGVISLISLVSFLSDPKAIDAVLYSRTTLECVPSVEEGNYQL